MSMFHSLPAPSLNALAASGGCTPGDIYYDNTNKITYLAVTGFPNSQLFPLGSLILTGEYYLSGKPGPTGATGPQGEQGATGPSPSLASQIALVVALG